nr:thioredoxin [uncultured Mogibacterium sp.]
MAAIELTSENFEQEVLQADKPVLVDFWASWCGPCKMLSPVIEEIAEERSDIKVGKVNIDEHPELAQKYGVMSIPTVLLLKDGEEVNKSVGAVPKKVLLDLIG